MHLKTVYWDLLMVRVVLLINEDLFIYGKSLKEDRGMFKPDILEYNDKKIKILCQRCAKCDSVFGDGYYCQSCGHEIFITPEDEDYLKQEIGIMIDEKHEFKKVLMFYADNGGQMASDVLEKWDSIWKKYRSI